LQLNATDDAFSLILTLVPQKLPVIHGENGVSQKSAGAGNASHYISFTRLKNPGPLARNGKSVHVSRTSWMEHEFFNHSLNGNQVGWDWLSVELEDGTELMLYQFRHRDGSLDPFSSGTFVDAQGKSTHLASTDFRLVPNRETWTSPATSAKYPVAWTIEVPKL